MKRALSLLCALIALCCLFSASCAGGEERNQSVFVFLSVRMKGNGDGTITAVAQNEFAIGSSVLPVTLTLYSSDTFQTNVGNMYEIESRATEDLNFLNIIEIVFKVQDDAYYCARIAYKVKGEYQYIQSDTLRYDKNGVRQ